MPEHPPVNSSSPLEVESLCETSRPSPHFPVTDYSHSRPEGRERESVLFLCEHDDLASAIRRSLQAHPFSLHVMTFEQLATHENRPDAIVLMELSSCPWPMEHLKVRLQKYFHDVPVIMLDKQQRPPEEVREILPFLLSYRNMPCLFEVLLCDLTSAATQRRLRKKNALLSSAVGIPVMESNWLPTQGDREKNRIMTFAQNGNPVLIQGEWGSGKHMIAQQIHESGPRRDKPFLFIACGALPPMMLEILLFGGRSGSKNYAGRLELADGGTVYLDRVEELPVSTQEKLERFLKEDVFVPVGGSRPMHADIQVIAGTEFELNTACLIGSFLTDFYHRLHVQPIFLPPLREQRGAIPDLAYAMLEQCLDGKRAFRPTITPEAMAKLQHYAWPGNLREFHQVMARTCKQVQGSLITPQDIALDSPLIRKRTGCSLAGMTMAEVGLQLLLDTRAALGNRQKAIADQMGVSVKTVYNKLREYGLNEKFE